MARLPTGVAPTPHKVRLKAYRADLIKRGGRRLNIDLEAPANQALAVVMGAMQAGKPGDAAKLKDAVSDALQHYASAISSGGPAPARTPGEPDGQ